MPCLINAALEPGPDTLLQSNSDLGSGVVRLEINCHSRALHKPMGENPE